MTTAQVIHEGLAFGEGPRWRDGRLWYSDFYRHAIAPHRLHHRSLLLPVRLFRPCRENTINPT